MPRYNPSINLKEGDSLIVDGDTYEIGGHIKNDTVEVKFPGENGFTERHIDWFGEIINAADSVVLVKA